jgi:hypothetical protein
MFEHRNNFFKQVSLIFGQIVFMHMRKENISFTELQNRVSKLGYKCSYNGLYQSLIGNNTGANNLFYWQRIFEALQIEINAQTFAQTLQDSQHFNTSFKAAKQAKKDAKKLK